MSNVSAMRSVGDNDGRDFPVELVEGFFGVLRASYGTCLAFVAEEEIRFVQRFVEWFAEDLRHKRIRARDRDLCLVLSRETNCFANCSLTCVRVGENVPFDEEPFRSGN